MWGKSGMVCPIVAGILEDVIVNWDKAATREGARS